MIGVVQRRGSKLAGLLWYLYGPGRACEHSSPHLVASWRHPAELEPPLRPDGHRDFRELTALMELPLILLGDRAPREHVYHVSLRAAPGDRDLSDDDWMAIAAQVMDRTGLSPLGREESGAPWVAVHHGDNHIHIVAVLARMDGRQASPHNDYHRIGEALARAEAEYGLQVTARWDRTADRPATRAEREKALAAGRPEPARFTLRRMAATAAAAARSEEEFFDGLRARGAQVRLRTGPAPGRAAGYAVSLPGDLAVGGSPVWFGGGRLAPDLSLPQLRRRWPAPAPQTPARRPDRGGGPDRRHRTGPYHPDLSGRQTADRRPDRTSGPPDHPVCPDRSGQTGPADHPAGTAQTGLPGPGQRTTRTTRTRPPTADQAGAGRLSGARMNDGAARAALRRAVARAAVAARSEQQFLVFLETAGLMVRVRPGLQPGRPASGYAVSLPSLVHRQDGRQVWYGGQTLDPLLSLPALRRCWQTGLPPRPAAGGDPEAGSVYAYAATAAWAAARMLRTSRRRPAADIAWAAADLILAVSETAGGPGLRRAADGFPRAARPPWGRIPAPSPVGLMLRTAAWLVAGCGPPGPAVRRSALAGLLRALAGLARAVADLRARQQRALQAAAAREAVAGLVAAGVPAWTAPAQQPPARRARPAAPPPRRTAARP